jgi:hypothetical protein
MLRFTFRPLSFRPARTDGVQYRQWFWIVDMISRKPVSREP